MRLGQGVRRTNDQDGSIVLDIDHGEMFTVNFVGSKILGMLEQNYSEAQITAEICQTFAISQKAAERDLRDFLNCLREHQLLDMESQDRDAT
jgi:Coenzyme PQQ synthesis protein D (PqqD)